VFCGLFAITSFHFRLEISSATQLCSSFARNRVDNKNGLCIPEGRFLFWLKKSMATTGSRNRLRWLAQPLEFGDFHAGFPRNVDEIFPRECVRPLGGELVAERRRIMVVEEDEVVANRQFKPGAYDQAVFDGTGNRSHIHYFVGADEAFSLHVSICCILVG